MRSYSYHLIIADPTPHAMKLELPAAIERGVTSFKVFMTYDLMKVSDAQFLEILNTAKGYGALLSLYTTKYE